MPHVGDIIIFNNTKMLLIESDENIKKFSWTYDTTPFKKGTAIVLEESIRFISIKLNKNTPVYSKRISDNEQWKKLLLKNENFIRFQKRHLKMADWFVY
jgi:hypothetical protein